MKKNKRRFSHLTARYIINRIAVSIDEFFYPKHPWLTSDSIKILKQLIKPSDVGVEFGSGRSTKWFAERLYQLTSIENNPVWYNLVKKSLVRFENVDYRLCLSDDDYAAQAHSFMDNSIDFCLVDGAVRDLCAYSMLSKVRIGGVIVVDNVNWFLPNDYTASPDSLRTPNGYSSDIWRAFDEEVSKFRKIWTSNGVTDTAIWIKTR